MPPSLEASTYLVDGVDLQTADVWLTNDGAGLAVFPTEAGALRLRSNSCFGSPSSRC